MRKRIYFDSFEGLGWPSMAQLAPYFVGTPYIAGAESGALHAEGLYGTGRFTPTTGRVDVSLYFVRHPKHGVTFAYSKWDGRTLVKEEYSSKGNVALLKKLVRADKGSNMPLGLFIPFEVARAALNEFLESGGELPTQIEWIRGKDLPVHVFPH